MRVARASPLVLAGVTAAVLPGSVTLPSPSGDSLLVPALNGMTTSSSLSSVSESNGPPLVGLALQLESRGQRSQACAQPMEGSTHSLTFGLAIDMPFGRPAVWSTKWRSSCQSLLLCRDPLWIGQTIGLRLDGTLAGSLRPGRLELSNLTLKELGPLFFDA